MRRAARSPPRRRLAARALPTRDLGGRAMQIPDASCGTSVSDQRAELIEFATAPQHALTASCAVTITSMCWRRRRHSAAEVLTIGFARRVATYKRLDLLIREPEWALSLLAGDRPMQLLLAGKAHPRDDDAKRVLHRLFSLKCAPIIAERVVFLDDYDLASGAALVRGCDVWLNLPRPPLEASGTSGMKSAANGGLQLSVLDGWWAEAYDGGNGWAISGEVDADHQAQDDRDAEMLRELLSTEVIPAFYERDDAECSARWLAMMRASLMTIAPRFSDSADAGRLRQRPVQPTGTDPCRSSFDSGRVEARRDGPRRGGERPASWSTRRSSADRGARAGDQRLHLSSPRTRRSRRPARSAPATRARSPACRSRSRTTGRSAGCH